MATDPMMMAEAMKSGGGAGGPPGAGGMPPGPPAPGGAPGAAPVPQTPEEAVQLLAQLGITPEMAPAVSAALLILQEAMGGGAGAPAPGGAPPMPPEGGAPPEMMA